MTRFSLYRLDRTEKQLAMSGNVFICMLDTLRLSFLAAQCTTFPLNNIVGLGVFACRTPLSDILEDHCSSNFSCSRVVAGTTWFFVLFPMTCYQQSQFCF